MVERGLLPTLNYRERGKGESIRSKDRISTAARRSMGFRHPPVFLGRVVDMPLMGLLRGRDMGLPMAIPASMCLFV
jgi:hypothetical protein